MAFNDEQRRNAAVIIRVGGQVGASARDILIALMTSMQESGLRNLNYGDRDSLGLFQQRTSMDWGSTKQITNPEYAARAFFLGAGTNKGLLDYSNRDSMSLTQAAQTVQRSGFPDAYAKHEGAARSLLDSLGNGKAVKGTLGAVPSPEKVDQPTLNDALADTIGSHPSRDVTPDGPPEVDALGEYINPALGEATSGALAERNNPGIDTALFGQSLLPQTDPARVGGTMPGLEDLMFPDQSGKAKVHKAGKPIKIGSGEFDVATGKTASGWRGEVVTLAKQMLGTPYVWGGSSMSGVDCSGLLQLIFGKAGIQLPRVSYQQANHGKRVGLDKLKPGDLVAWDNSSRNNGADHIAVYVGGGKIIEAPRPGSSVQLNSIYDRGRAWGVRMGR